MSEVVLRRSVIIAQSWFIASEIIRRHPGLLLTQTHPGGGLYDCLSLRVPAGTGSREVISLNRNGSLHAFGSGPGGPKITWLSTLTGSRDVGGSEVGPHTVVRELEHRAGLQIERDPVRTTPAILVYRAIARVLLSLVNDRRPWDVVNTEFDSSGPGQVTPPPADADAERAEYEESHYRRDPLAPHRFWTLQCDGNPVATFDTDGFVTVGGEAHNLVLVHVSRGERLTATIAAILGDVLP